MMVFWEMTSGISFSILYQCLVRQGILFLRQSTELFVKKLTYFLRAFRRRLSPYSALSLVRQRIHALRQSTELLNMLTIFLRGVLGR